MIIRQGNGKEKFLEEALALGREKLVGVSGRSDNNNNGARRKWKEET